MGTSDGRVNFTISDIEKVYKSRFIYGNAVELLGKSGETFQRIFDAVKEAKNFICLEFYIFRNDETGTELSDILMEKAKEGVSVYMLYDHFGSFGTPLEFWRALKKSGINIRASHPFKWSAPFRYVHRDHRKLIIIDGETAFTGGLNIANEYRGFHLRKKEPWRDTGIIIKGPAAGALFETFKTAWTTWGGQPINVDYSPPAPQGNLPVIPVFAHSGRGRRRMRRLLYYSINHANKSILLTTAYFTPSRRMVETLEDAVKRGVGVKLLIPEESDVPAATYAARAFFTRLLRAGVEIYNYQGEVLHSKAYVFDGYWSVVGSANLDFQSLRWNDEGNVGIIDEGFAKQMTDTFNSDLMHSLKIEENVWLKRPFCEKFKERFFSLFRRRL